VGKSQKNQSAGESAGNAFLRGGMQAAEVDLKQYFLDQLFLSQIKWATSTTSRKSYPNSSYYSDARLRSLLQRFPDTFLVLYQPIFELKKAKIEIEVLLLGPSNIYCITYLDPEVNALYREGTGHFWIKTTKDSEQKILNPIISVNRMSKIVSQIFQRHEVELSVKKVVIAENGLITAPKQLEDTLFIDKQNYEAWIKKLRNYHSPMKMMQVRAAKSLMNVCVTKSVKRTDWSIT